MPETPTNAEIYSVSQLNREARQLLENELPDVWIEGEISNLAQPGSGHLYFTLKDSAAQLRCAMFRGNNRRLTFSPQDGTQVLARGRVSIYEPRGSFQFIVSHMEEAGEGILRRRFEQLKQRLSAEGLFDEAHKQPAPALPERIGVVTSPSGAAIRDILHVLERRYPLAEVIVYPTRVQGTGVEHEIATAIQTADERRECDVLILARGGGSLEDLWCFNEEIVARALYECNLPVIAGVGHEVDFTIADLAADVRAPTPSGAAELVTPDRAELLSTMQSMERRLIRTLNTTLRGRSENILQLTARLRRSHPGTRLQQLQQRTDDLHRQMISGLQSILLNRHVRQQHLLQRLQAACPIPRILRTTSEIDKLGARMTGSIQERLGGLANRLALAAGQLNAVSPLATLERGYAVVRSQDTGRVITDSQQVQPGQKLTTRLARGSVDSTVDRINRDKES